MKPLVDLADDDHYYLARAFPSAAEREPQLGAFYGSDEWQWRFEGDVMELIDAHHTVVIPSTPCIERAVASGCGATHRKQHCCRNPTPLRRRRV